MKHSVYPLLVGLALVFLSACEPETSTKKEQPVRVNAAIAAVVNGEYIQATEVELEAAAQGLIDVGERLDVKDPVFSQILEQLIDQKLLSQEALARGLDQDESARHRLHAARERILGNLYVEKLVSEQVDEAAVMKMYRAQVELQQLGEEVLVRHILVKTQAEADKLYKDLRNGKEFAELAFTYSIDRATSAEGGLMGYFLPDELSDPFPSVINRTAVGAHSKPFETELGWHILKVDDRRKEEPPSLDEMRPKIVQYLTLSEISKSLKRLRTRSEIETVTGKDSPDSLDVDAGDVDATDDSLDDASDDDLTDDAGDVADDEKDDTVDAKPDTTPTPKAE